MQQDALNQHCSLYGITRCRNAKKVLGIIHGSIGNNLEISVWDVISILLLNNADVLCLAVAYNVVHPVRGRNLAHYTLSLPQSGDTHQHIIYEGIMTSGGASSLARGFQSLISTANSYNGHNGSQIFYRQTPLCICIKHPSIQLCNVKLFFMFTDHILIIVNCPQFRLFQSRSMTLCTLTHSLMTQQRISIILQWQTMWFNSKSIL